MLEAPVVLGSAPGAAVATAREGVVEVVEVVAVAVAALTAAWVAVATRADGPQEARWPACQRGPL